MSENLILALPSEYLLQLLYGVPILLVWLIFVARRKLASARNVKTLRESYSAGLIEPVSLHPKIRMELCLACGSCVDACPEENVLGMVGNKVELINPTHCIGHGACAAACPFDAIDLVFGSETRGVDLPVVGANFETNVPGIFIAGELGGMGLIRNAITQGRQAMDSIAARAKSMKTVQYDVVVVGCGPAGFSATLGAKQYGLKYLTIDQESFGGTVSHYPRGKIVMTHPAELPLIGKMKFNEVPKEKLIAFWESARRKAGLVINTQERMVTAKRLPNGFEITTTKGRYHTTNILLAIGRRGSPRKLDVPGEDLPKVVYRLIDPEQYRGQKVLVVGGGDSALEAAASIAEQPNTSVVLSYRGEAFSRAKEKNRQRVDAAQKAGKLKVLLNSQVKGIEPDSVTIEQDARQIQIPNQAVIVNVGGVLPTGLLQSLGIDVVTKRGVA